MFRFVTRGARADVLGLRRLSVGSWLHPQPEEPRLSLSLTPAQSMLVANGCAQAHRAQICSSAFSPNFGTSGTLGAPGAHSGSRPDCS